MKQLVVTGSFPFSTHTYVIREIASVLARGDEVIILAPTDGDEAGDRLADQLNIPKQNIIYSDCLKSPLFTPHISRFSRHIIKAADRNTYGFLLSERRKSFFSALLKQNKLADIDIIHAHFAGWAYEIALPLSQLLEIPFTVTVHNGNLSEIPVNILSDLQKYSSQIICVSSQWRKIWKQRTGSDKKLTVIPNGIDLTEFPQQSPPKNSSSIKIMSVSRLIPAKRISDCMYALRNLLDAGFNCTYEVIGEGPLMEDLEALKTELKLAERMIFHGVLPHEEVRKKLISADIFVHPSELESFGIVVAEAMASFLPVVAAKSGGVEGIVMHDKTGFLYEPGDITLMTEQLHQLCSDNDMRISCGKKAYSRIKAEFSWDEHMKLMDEVWNNALSCTN